VIATPDLIDSLARDLPPMRRLSPLLWRAFGRLFLAAIILGLLAISQGIRPDLAQCLRETRFVASLAAAMLTGIGAAIAAFMLS
jgi:hypothetical protein